jgi:RES domain-containing protein
MHVYRVVGYDADADSGAPGHPLAVDRRFQRAGRWDNPDLYSLLYASTSPAGAIAESFGNLANWSDEMFSVPYIRHGRRALVTFAVPSDLSLVDFDDARTLLDRGLRPTQIVVRNAGFTQQLAAEIFAERTPAGSRRWHGVRWWSFQRGFWTNVALWSADDRFRTLSVADVEPLSMQHPAVLDARTELARPER